jgi:DNA-binding winged helix-turn-helix (wHTH) protein
VLVRCFGFTLDKPTVLPVPEPNQATRIIRFGVFEVDLLTTELRKRGVRIRLAGQSFQVLEALLRRPGELVTRKELKDKLWPSDSFGDFEHGLNAAVNRVREALGDSSDNPRFIETLPRRGYRFLTPINGAQSEVRAPILSRPPEFADSIAVLPFENAGGEPDMEYLSDGITASIINNLSQVSRLRVVPRTTVFRYKGHLMQAK